MSYRSRIHRQRNAQQNDHDQSKDQDKFFGRASEKSKSNGTKNAFFQAKSNDTTGTEDSLEKEADKTAAEMASKDVKDKKEADKTAAEMSSKDQKDKKEETIQRLATPEEDKQTSTNDERQKNDKERQS